MNVFARLIRGALLAAPLVLLIGAASGDVSAEELQFKDRAEEARFRRLASELRCLVCQNQSLEDSHAPLALDLKKEVQAQIRSGADDDQIIEYLVRRYGDFVRYRPPLRPGTWLLWGGPPLLLLVGGAAAWRVVRRHGGRVPVADGSAVPPPIADRKRHSKRRAAT